MQQSQSPTPVPTLASTPEPTTTLLESTTTTTDAISLPKTLTLPSPSTLTTQEDTATTVNNMSMSTIERPTPRDSSSDAGNLDEFWDGQTVGAIVGGALCCSLLVALLIFVVLRFRTRNKATTGEREPSDSVDMGANEDGDTFHGGNTLPIRPRLETSRSEYAAVPVSPIAMYDSPPTLDSINYTTVPANNEYNSVVNQTIYSQSS
jgi:hypothetical protein